MISVAIFDLDGTVYLGSDPIPGASRLIRSLDERGVKVIFYTNRAYRTPEQIAAKLEKLWGEEQITVDPQDVMTGATVTARGLGDGATAYYLGDNLPNTGKPALVQALEQCGVRITDVNPEYVVVGFTSTLHIVEDPDEEVCPDGANLTKAVQLIDAGAMFVATNPDRYILVKEKRVPENGAIVAAVEAATGKMPMMFGKPEPHGVTFILEDLNVSPDKAMLVGDNVATDIPCGRAAGVLTVHTNTGVSRRHEGESLSQLIRPHEFVTNYDDPRWVRILGWDPR